MKHGVNIPALTPYPCGDPASMSSYVNSQPIIQLKELVVDNMRYQEWKAMLARTPCKQTPRKHWPYTSDTAS